MSTNIEITASGKRITGTNIVMAAIGAAGVCVGYSFLAKLGATFALLVPYIAGGLLFATLVGTFYFTMQLFKDMRARARYRVSFWDGYTAIAVFTVMGYMATACMHAFLATGNPLDLWNKGSMAAGLFTVFYGLARFCGDLWKEDSKSKN